MDTRYLNILLNVSSVSPTPIVPNLTTINLDAVSICKDMVDKGLLEYTKEGNNCVLLTSKGREYKSKNI